MGYTRCNNGAAKGDPWWRRGDPWKREEADKGEGDDKTKMKSRSLRMAGMPASLVEQLESLSWSETELKAFLAANMLHGSTISAGGSRQVAAACISASIRRIVTPHDDDGSNSVAVKKSRCVESSTTLVSAAEDTLDTHAKSILLLGEHLRLRIARERCKPCRTLHQAAQVVHAEANGDKHTRELVKELNLLNDAYTGIRHFDGAHLKDLSARVETWLSTMQNRSPDCTDIRDCANTRNVCQASDLVQEVPKDFALDVDAFVLPEVPKENVCVLQEVPNDIASTEKEVYMLQELPQDVVPESDICGAMSRNMENIANLIVTQQNECRAMLAEQQMEVDNRFTEIESCLTSSLCAAEAQAKTITNQLVRFAEPEIIHFHVETEAESSQNDNDNDNCNDSDLYEEEEEEEMDEELMELYDDPDYIEFLRNGGVHERHDGDLEGYE